jgi:hypothetical protein
MEARRDKQRPIFKYVFHTTILKKQKVLLIQLQRASKFVTIIVSSALQQKTFIIHKNLIYYASPFFKAAFEGYFAEGQSQTMT